MEFKDVSYLYDFIILGVLSMCMIHLYKCYFVFPKKKFYAYVATRLLCIGCIVLALLDMNMVMTTKETTTLFLVDQSLSVSDQKNKIQTYINDQLKDKDKHDYIGVISFSKEPMVEVPLTKKLEKIQLTTTMDTKETNLQKAITFSRGYFKEGTNKRLILFTDGKETLGKVEKVLPLLKQDKIDLKIYPLKSKDQRDVQLSSVGLPKNYHHNQKVPIKIEAHSNIKGMASMYIFKDKQKVVEKSIPLKKGYNEWVIEHIIESKDQTLSVEIQCKEDENPYNNRIQTSIHASEKPRILVVGNKEDTKNLCTVLNGLDVFYQSSMPNQVPYTLKDLSSFDAISMVNVDYESLPKGFDKALKKSVEELGVGLMVVGGENTFALGHYKDTTLEDILPVSSKMIGNEKQPNTALVLAIDASGSMEDKSGGVEKIEMAKEAAIRSIEILGKNDQSGILAFSDVIDWVYPLSKIKNIEDVESAIQTLHSRGGTMIQPSLIESMKSLESAQVKVKHMILLTDGQGEKKGYEDILQRMKKDKITVSTVAFGKNADTSLLQNIARQTNGRYYYAKDFNTIPKIFAKETYLATKKYLNYRQFTPRKVQNMNLFSKEQIPDLKGYMGTGIKKGAQLILQSDEEDPILVSWQYGLGHVMVFTSDIDGKWSGEWVKSHYIQNFLNKIINYCVKPSSENIEVEWIDENHVVVDTKSKAFGQSVEMVVKSEVEVQKIQLSPDAVGIFKGELPHLEPKDYIIEIRCKEKDKVIQQKVEHRFGSYSKEYNMNVENALVTYLDDEDCILDLNSKVFTLPISLYRTYQPLKNVLMGISLISFIGSLWIRKFL